MTATTTHAIGPAHRGVGVFESPLTCVAAIWTATAVCSVLAPDMVTGSEHQHLPFALMTAWVWACVGSIYALMTPQRGSRTAWTLSVVVAWALMALTTIFAPVMVTGTDPTSIPLAVMIAPPVAAVVTGMLSLRQANLAAP